MRRRRKEWLEGEGGEEKCFLEYSINFRGGGGGADLVFRIFSLEKMLLLAIVKVLAFSVGFLYVFERI